MEVSNLKGAVTKDRWHFVEMSFGSSMAWITKNA
jgi:hypothetical protein